MVKWANVRPVTVWETIGIFVLIPGALYGVLALFTLWPKVSGRARYRPGASWDHEPVWWAGNPDGTGLLEPHQAPGSQPRPTARGGARGSW